MKVLIAKNKDGKLIFKKSRKINKGFELLIGRANLWYELEISLGKNGYKFIKSVCEDYFKKIKSWFYTDHDRYMIHEGTRRYYIVTKYIRVRYGREVRKGGTK